MDESIEITMHPISRVGLEAVPFVVISETAGCEVPNLVHLLMQNGDDTDVTIRETAPIDKVTLITEEIAIYTEFSRNGTGCRLVCGNTLERIK
jgi:hypothetical protein